jgi:hypothetical protein
MHKLPSNVKINESENVEMGWKCIMGERDVEPLASVLSFTLTIAAGAGGQRFCLY